MSDENKTLTAEDVACILSVNKETVYRLARQNLIPHFHIGRAVRFERKKVEDYISKKMIDD